MTAWASIDASTSPPSLALGVAKAEHNLCLQIPGCNQGKDGIWRLPLTWPGYVSFRCVWAVQPIQIYPDLAAWEQAEWEQVQRRMAMRTAPDCGDPELLTRLVELELPGRPQLDPVQRAHVEWLATWRRCIIGDPMGNGKTPPLIRALQVVPDALPALVICPDSAPIEWQRKLAAWAPGLNVRVVTGTANARRKALTPGADVYVLAWSAVRLHTRLAAYPGQRFVTCDEHGGTMGKSTAACEVHLKELNGLGLRTVVADECHRMKDARGKWSRAVQYLAHHAENFWAVTGTLTASDVGDLWPVMHAISPNGWPARSRYMDLWAQEELAWKTGKSYAGLRPEHQAFFHTAADPLFRRIAGRAGRPERAEPEFRYPELSPPQKRAYVQLRKELLTDLPSGHQIVPGNHAVKFSRAVQLASSMVKVVDEEDTGLGFTREKVHLELPSNKADDLLDFLAYNEGQWIVFCFQPELMDLCAHKLDLAKIPHSSIIGGMSLQAKDTAQQLFQTNPEMRVIFINAAATESIDLQAAAGVVFLQPPPSFIMREQVIGRADRRGRDTPCRIIYMISPGTADQRLYELGNEKAERHDEVVRDAELLRWVMSAGELEGAG